MGVNWQVCFFLARFYFHFLYRFQEIRIMFLVFVCVHVLFYLIGMP